MNGGIFVTIRVNGGAEVEATLPPGFELNVRGSADQVTVSANPVNPVAQPATLNVAKKPE